MLRHLNAILNVIISLGYLEFSFFLIRDMRKNVADARDRWINLALLGVFLTCGAHHFFHAFHESFTYGVQNPIAPLDWEIIPLILQIIYIGTWSYLRWERLLGGIGDRLISSRPGVIMSIIIYSVIVLVGSVATSNPIYTLNVAAIINMAILVLYMGISWMIISPQIGRPYWSLSAIVLAGYFSNCAISHWLVGLAVMDGQYLPQVHMTIVDALGLFPAASFILLARNRRVYPSLKD